MRINWETPVDELYHGENVAYIDLDADEIVHFKYIKREKLPNGKYRYYYDQSELERYKNEADQAQKDYQKANMKVANARVNKKTADYKLDRAYEKRRSARTTNEIVDAGNARNKAYKGVQAAERALNIAENNRKTARILADDAKKAYNKKKIISFPARTIAKGAVKVANLFSGANKKPKKKSKKKSGSKVTYSSTSSLMYVK